MDTDLERNETSGNRTLEKTADRRHSAVNGGFSGLKDQLSAAYNVGLVHSAEKLVYLLTFELFLLFVIFTHYETLDNHNKFLTPMATGALTSSMGQTITSLLLWFRQCGHKSVPELPFVWRNHMKFFLWGFTSGILVNFWIEALVDTFGSSKWYFCVLLDQTIGTLTFQSLFAFFSTAWDIEVAHADPKTFEEIIDMIYKLIKLSYCVWPYVSIFCFSLAPAHLIFPINCAFGTFFAVLLAISSN